jgi:CHAD domain-containing protein
MTTEIEAKYLIEDPVQILGFVDTLQSDGLDVQPLPAVDVVDRYLDTPDWQVFRAGWAYRHRQASGKRKVCLKSNNLSRDGVQKREELEQYVPAFSEDGDPIPPGPVARALDTTTQEALRELFQVQNHRQLFNVRTAQGALIELAIDQATITATAPLGKLAPGQMKFEELEMELKEGPERSLRELAEAVGQRFGLLPSRLSKFERGLQAVGLAPPLARRKETRFFEENAFLRELRDRQLQPKDPVIKLAYRSLLDQFERMLVEEPKAWEGLDPEGVHQMRVATRRMRAAFRAFKDVLPVSPVDSFNGDFKWLAAVLGNVRDLDVYQVDFQHYVEEIPTEDAAHLADYWQHLARHWQNARKELIACLSAGRYERLRQRFAEFLQRGPSPSPTCETASLTIGHAARRLIGKRHKRVLRDGRAIGPESPDEAFHALRIQGKRLRYLLEFFRPIYGESLAPFIKRLKELQDVLGEFQDACVATQRLRQYAEGMPMRAENRGQLIALGQLISSQRSRAAARRASFRQVWKHFDRKGRRKQIRAVLET